MQQARDRQEARFSDGIQERDFVHVGDVVAAIDLALDATRQDFTAINLGSGSPVQVKGVLLEIARIFEAERLFQFGAIPRRMDEPMVRYADTTAAWEILGWRPSVILTEWLRRVAAAHVDERSRAADGDSGQARKAAN
jgi:dTDP-L-rhamnose 4-epimerase